MGSIAGLLWWRRSALCRRTDLTEGWITLCAALLLLLGAPLAGVAGGLAAHGELSDVVREQHRHRHRVWATVEQPVDRPPAGPGRAGTDEAPERFPVLASWEAPDRVTHSGTVQAVRPLAPGERFPVWTDAQGALTSPPLPPGGAVAHSVAAGLVACGLTGVAVVAGRRAAVRRLLRRRYAGWEEEWARIGPDWGRADSNS